MVDQNITTQVAQLLAPAQSIIIAVAAQPTRDMLAAATALQRILQAQQKNVRLVSPRAVDQAVHPGLVGLQELQLELGNQNLTISFPYLPEQVDKVSYHIGEETNRFFLTIKPKQGSQPIDSSQVEFSYTGAATDVFITVGVNELENLEQLYYDYEDAFRDFSIISLHTHPASFATLSIDAGSLSSLSEAVTAVATSQSWSIDSDAATNLLSGIEVATRHFTSYSATAETFDAVSSLLRAGARRIRVEQTAPQPLTPPELTKTPQETQTVPSSQPQILQEEPAAPRRRAAPKKTSQLPAEFNPTGQKL